MGFYRSHRLIGEAKLEFKDIHSNKVSFIKVKLYSLFLNHQSLRNETGQCMHITQGYKLKNTSWKYASNNRKSIKSNLRFLRKREKIQFGGLRVAQIAYSFSL